MVVDLMQAYSKRLDLAETLVSAVRQLRQAQAHTTASAQSVRSAPLSTRQWRIGDWSVEAVERVIRLQLLQR
jgi:hypothetical protein